MSSRSIRFRVTALAVVVVVVVLVLSSFLLVVLQRSSLTDSVDEGLKDRAEGLMPLVKAGGAKGRIPRLSKEEFVQVVGPAGMVVASTANLTGRDALPIARPEAQGNTFQTRTDLSVDDQQVRVLSRPLPDGGTLIVAASYDIVAESTAALVRSLAWIIPPVAVLLGLLIWWIVGRSLRPVEAIRSEVADIEVTDLNRRIHRPGTGDEIDRLAGTMNEMLARLERAVDRQQRFVADASHELRSPLTRMRSTLEVELATGTAGDPAILNSALEDVTDMQDMVADLLYLTRADEGGVRMQSRGLDLDDLVLREARRISDRGRVKVDISAVSAAHIRGDAAQLTRAVRNLLENAERHAGSRVTLTLREAAGQALLTVGDDGPGIATDKAALVFERFGRVDSARTAGAAGVGLGLPITRDIVQRHGGTVALGATDGVGAVFELRLPSA